MQDLVLICGDLALLHDSNGWLWRQPRQARLTLIVINNAGGGIFEQLPIRVLPETSLDFERLFAMDQQLDLCALAKLHGVVCRRLSQPDHLQSSLDWALDQPLCMLEVITQRRADALLRTRLRKMASGPLTSPPLP